MSDVSPFFTKLSILLSHVSTRFGKTDGNDLINNMKSVKVIIPEKIMVNKYLMGYPATKHNNITIQNNIAAVEKFAGRISERIINTGNHSDSKLCLKPIFKFFILAKYLEVYIIKTTPAISINFELFIFFIYCYCI